MQAPRSLSAVVIPFRRPKQIENKKPVHKAGVLLRFPGKAVSHRYEGISEGQTRFSGRSLKFSAELL